MHFTYVALLIFGGGIGVRNTFVLGLSKSLLLGCNVSFSCAPLFDAHAYSKMRRKYGWSTVTFWVGNVVLHMVPLFLVWDAKVTLVQGMVAAAIHIFWYVVISKGTGSLDHVYVPLSGRRSWPTLACLAFVTEVGSALIST
jgi:hypothetical protein